MDIDYSNYIIAHHLDDKIYMIPLYPESITDTLDSIYQSSNILARTAPLQSWSGSGPRTLSFSLRVHRDLDYDENGNKLYENGIEELMEQYQALTLPNYSIPMLVVPPKITIRIGSHIRITGIPQIGMTKQLPIDENGKYLSGEFTFEVKELEPTDAVEVSTSLFNARGESRR